MTSPHLDPDTHGTTFGVATVTVDLDAGDCVVRAPRPGRVLPVMRRVRFNSLDEIRGAYQVQIGRARTDPVARDVAAALKFAGQKLKDSQRKGKA